jgi:hypothetical protein
MKVLQLTFLIWLKMNFSDKKSSQSFAGNYRGYYSLVNSGKEQSQTTHGDRYDENRPYSIVLH